MHIDKTNQNSERCRCETTLIYSLKKREEQSTYQAVKINKKKFMMIAKKYLIYEKNYQPLICTAINKKIYSKKKGVVLYKTREKINGSIINIVDQRVVNLTPFFTTYTLTKSMLWTLTQTLALSLAPKIKVNAIGPGPTFPSKRQTSKQFKNQYRKVPLKKAVDPNEIAEAVLFILNSNSLTGQLINIDSGQHLGWAHANNKKIIDE